MKSINYELPMEDSEVIKKVESLRSAKLINKCHLFENYNSKYPNITIGEAVNIEVNKNEYGCDAKERPAIALVRVILSIHNNYNRNVRKRMNLLEAKGDLNTFDDLKRIVSSTNKKEFFDYWDYESNVKYNILLDMLKAIDKLRNCNKKAMNDYELINEWAKGVDIDNLKNDVFGVIPNVAEATVQHLRMNFGIDTTKPDLQVVRVLKREFNIIANKVEAINYVKSISNITSYKMIEIDQIFVNYGSGYYEPEEEERSKKGNNLIKTNKMYLNGVKSNREVDYITSLEESFEKEKSYEIQYFIEEINKSIASEKGIYEKLLYLIEKIDNIKKSVLEGKENDIKIKKRGDKAFIFELDHKVKNSKEQGKNSITLWLKREDFDIDIRKRTNGRESINNYDINLVVDMFKERLIGIITANDSNMYRR